MVNRYEYLVDAHNASDPRHAKAKALRDDALCRVLTACITPQVLYEFYANLTGPKAPSPLTPTQAAREVENYFRTRRIAKIYPQRRTTLTVLRLVQTYNLTRQDIFDATLVAVMLDNSVTQIYTENEADFAKFSAEGLTVVNPFV